MTPGSTLDPAQLSRLPPSDESPDLFAYRALEEPAAAPVAEARYRLARRYVEEENGPERLRLVLVMTYEPVRDTLDCLAYIWRAERRDVIWGLERWPVPGNRLALYALDASFSPQPARRLHERYRAEGASAVARAAEEILQVDG